MWVWKQLMGHGVLQVHGGGGLIRVYLLQRRTVMTVHRFALVFGLRQAAALWEGLRALRSCTVYNMCISYEPCHILYYYIIYDNIIL
jgi:hypothetical protein